MKRLLLAISVSLPMAGCAHGLDASLDGVEKFAAGTYVAIDEATKLHEAGVKAQIAYCKVKGLGPDATVEERAACMGLLGKGELAEPAFEKLSDGYDLVAEGLELMRAASEDLAPVLEAAQEARKR